MCIRDSNNTHHSDERGFGWMYANAKKIDSISEDRTYAEWRIDRIISSEMLIPLMLKQPKYKDPKYKDLSWHVLHKSIEKKYNKVYADRIILHAKTDWYGYTENWKSFTKYKIECVEKYDTALGGLNDHAWSIFQHSNDPDELKTAIGWCKKAMKQSPDDSNLIDTYANLLYKMGKKDEAILWDEKALKQVPDDTEVQATLKKMKNGVPTW